VDDQFFAAVSRRRIEDGLIERIGHFRRNERGDTPSSW